MTPAELIVKAHRAIHSSGTLLAEGDFDDTVNRAYYGMFHAARAALAQKGIETDDKKESHEKHTSRMAAHLFGAVLP